MIKILLFLALLTMDVLQPAIGDKTRQDGCFYDEQCPYIPCHIVWCHIEAGLCYRVPNCA